MSETVSEMNHGHAANRAERLGATATDAANRLGSQASELGEDMYRQAMDAGRYAIRQAKQQPMTVALVVGAAGVLLGYLLGRSGTPEPRTLRSYIRDGLHRG